MTLSDLTSQFLGLMNRTDLKNNTTLAATFITQAIQRIQRDLRVPFMEKVVEYTIPTTFTASGGLSIPSDLLELIDLSVDSDGDSIIDYPLQRVQLKEAQRRSQISDIPRVFARKAGNWIIGPAPAVNSIIEIVYYAQFPALVNPTDTNTLSIVGWDAIVYGALSAACDYYNDERSQRFEQRYLQIMQTLQEQADGDELTADAAVRPCLGISNDYTNDDGVVE